MIDREDMCYDNRVRQERLVEQKNIVLAPYDPDNKLKKRINMIPIKRIAKPSEVASYNYFLCSEENSLITGQKLNISGGE